MSGPRPQITPPLFGDNRIVINKRKAIRDGYRIFRAWHSCGCCRVDMAFRSLHNVRVQFDMPKFADVVRDDMGNVFECVNTGRGFTEVKLKVNKVVIPSLPLPHSIGTQSTAEPVAQL